MGASVDREEVRKYGTEKQIQGDGRNTQLLVLTIKDDLSSKLWEITIRWDVRLVHERTAHQMGFLVRVW